MRHASPTCALVGTDEVYAIDAAQVAAELECSARELLESLRDGEAAAFPIRQLPESGGGERRAVADEPVGQVEWHSNLAYRPPALAHTPAVRRALISTVPRDGRVEPSGEERDLMRFGAHPILLQALRQIADAGVDDVLIVGAGAKLETVRHVVHGSPLVRFMRVRFCDALADGAEAPRPAERHARSLLAARSEFDDGEPFLLCTADHCCESALVRALSDVELPSGVHGAVLTSSAAGVSAPHGCASGSLRVDADARGVVRAIGCGLSEELPIEAGLFLLDRTIFAALDRLDASAGASAGAGAPTRARTLSLGDALALLASERALLAVDAGARLWCSVDAMPLCAQAHVATLDSLELARGAEPRPAPRRSASASSPPPRAGAAASRASPYACATQLSHASDGPLTSPLLGDVAAAASDVQRERDAPVHEPPIAEVRSLLHLPLLPTGIDLISISTAIGASEPHGGAARAAPHRATHVARSPPSPRRGALDERLLVEIERAAGAEEALIEVVPVREGERALDTLKLTTTSAVGEPVHVQLTVQRSVPAIGWVILLVGLLCMSSSELGFRAVGDDVSLLVRLSWRFQLATLFLLPWALVRISSSGRVRASLAHPLHWLLVLVAAAGWWFHFLSFAVALLLMPAPAALLFNNMVPLILLAVRVLRCAPLTAAEGLGALVALGGSVILALSHSAHARGGARAPPAATVELPLLGAAIAFSGAFGGVAYMLACKRLRPVMEPVVQFALICFIAWLLMLPVVATQHDPHPARFGAGENDIFGWVRADKAARALGAAFVCEVMGNLSVVVALKYVSPLVVSVITLLSPLVAGFAGMAIGEPAPTVMAWVGMGTTLCGTAAVVVGASTSSTTVDIGLAH